MNNLLDRVRAHLEGCAPCSTFEACEDFLLLHAEGQFNQRVRFRLWIDGTEILFFPVNSGSWHLRYAFPTATGHFLTAHYYGRPAGSLRTFERLITYARANLLSANEDFISHLQGARPIVAHAGFSID